MELKWLDDFVALVRTGSFSRAADERNVTQPAYSRRIRSLEYWLGVTLFDRSSFPVQLTTAGEEFLPRAQALIAEINVSRQDLRLMHARSQTAVRIVTLHTLALSLLPRIVARFARLHPEGSLSILPSIQDIEAYFDTLQTGLSDVVLSYESAMVKLDAVTLSQLSVLRIGRDQMIPVASPSLAAALSENWLEAKKEPVPILAYTSFSFSEKVVGPVLHRHSGKFRTVFESPLSESLRRVALHGTGVAWLPAELVATDLAAGALIRLPGDDLAPEVMITAYRLAAPRSPMVEALWRLLEERDTLAGPSGAED